MNARNSFFLFATSLSLSSSVCHSAPAPGASAPSAPAPQEWRWPPISLTNGVEAQPLLAATKRLTETMDWMGNPLPASVKAALNRAALEKNDAERKAMLRAFMRMSSTLGKHETCGNMQGEICYTTITTNRLNYCCRCRH